MQRNAMQVEFRLISAADSPRSQRQSNLFASFPFSLFITLLFLSALLRYPATFFLRVISPIFTEFPLADFHFQNFRSPADVGRAYTLIYNLLTYFLVNKSTDVDKPTQQSYYSGSRKIKAESSPKS